MRQLRWLLLSILMVPALASAQESRVGFLSDKLRDPDFRVRTNAALALGATATPAAVTPLCGALSDSAEVVRQAAAAGLQRLNQKSGVECLTARKQVEPDAKVKGQIDRALTSLQTIADAEPAATPQLATPRENSQAKYYVQIGAVANRTERSASEIEALVRSAVIRKLDEHGSFQIAPANETVKAAKSAMSKRKIKSGFYLAVSVSQVGGGSAKVSVSVFNYPGKSLKATIPGSSSTNSGSSRAIEDQLLDRAVGSAVSTFEQNLEALL